MKFKEKVGIMYETAKAVVSGFRATPQNIAKVVMTAGFLYQTTVTPIYAKTINSVKSIRKGVDSAFFDQVRFKYVSNNTFLLRAGCGIDFGRGYEVNFLGSYNGSNVTGSAAVLGDRIGLEANLAPGSKTVTLEGTAAGFLGQGTVNSTRQGRTLTARVARAEDIGNGTLQVGVSGTRNPQGQYNAALDVFGVIVKKAGKTTIVPYAGGSINKDLKGYDYVGVVLIPDNSKISIGFGASSSKPLSLKDYTTSAEVRVSK